MCGDCGQMETVEEKHLAGCCGLYCGLCPRFQSKAPSRCLSCHLGEQRSYCSVYRCCVTKRGLFTCAGCDEYPCERLLRVLGVEEGLDSFISHKPALPNLDRIREVGLLTYLEEQRERRLLVEHLLDRYNEGSTLDFRVRLSTPREAATNFDLLLSAGTSNGPFFDYTFTGNGTHVLAPFQTEMIFSVPFLDDALAGEADEVIQVDISNCNVALGVTNMAAMFREASAFNQDLSRWCVTLIPSKPDLFDSRASGWILPDSRPIWGTCP